MSKYLVLHTKDTTRRILKPKVMRSFYQQLSRGHVYIDFIKWQSLNAITCNRDYVMRCIITPSKLIGVVNKYLLLLVNTKSKTLTFIKRCLMPTETTIILAVIGMLGLFATATVYQRSNRITSRYYSKKWQQELISSHVLLLMSKRSCMELKMQMMFVMQCITNQDIMPMSKIG